MKHKKSKLNLIFIFLNIVVGTAFMFSAALHIYNTSAPSIIGRMEFVFQVGLALVVITAGLKMFNEGMDNLKKFLHKVNGRKTK